MIPARWRMITEHDRSIVSFKCSGDGVDACRAPSTWVAERVDESGAVLAIVTSRCPDHIPVRALQTLMPMPVVTREGIRAALTNPPLHPSTPPVPPLASMPIVTSESEKCTDSDGTGEHHAATSDSDDRFVSPKDLRDSSSKHRAAIPFIDPHLDEDDV